MLVLIVCAALLSIGGVVAWTVSSCCHRRKMKQLREMLENHHGMDNDTFHAHFSCIANNKRKY